MESKMEKEPQSLVVQMKPEYASSEVYSTVGSEAPPVSTGSSLHLSFLSKILMDPVDKMFSHINF